MLFAFHAIGAQPTGKIIDLSATNIDATYAGSENEFVAPGTDSIGCIKITNNSNDSLRACYTEISDSACTSIIGTGKELLVPAKSFVRVCNDYVRGLLIRAASGISTSGELQGWAN